MSGGQRARARNSAKRGGNAKAALNQAIEAGKEVSLAFIDRGEPVLVPATIVALALLVVVCRMPSDALSKMPDMMFRLLETRGVVVGLLTAATAALLAACVILCGVVFAQRRIHNAEIKRMANVNRLLQERMDSDRPSSLPPNRKSRMPGTQPGDRP